MFKMLFVLVSVWLVPLNVIFMQESWRKAVAEAVLSGISTPAFSAALAFFDGYRSGWLPANLLQVDGIWF